MPHYQNKEDNNKKPYCDPAILFKFALCVLTILLSTILLQIFSALSVPQNAEPLSQGAAERKIYSPFLRGVGPLREICLEAGMNDYGSRSLVSAHYVRASSTGFPAESGI